MRDFKKYHAWIDSHKLVLEIYKATRSFPKEETYGIISQIRRASVSIPTNIAEGAGKKSEKDFSRFLEISFASAAETEYLLILSRDLEYINNELFDELCNQVISVKKQLYQLITKINA